MFPKNPYSIAKKEDAMHISEGVLSPAVLAGGMLLTATGTAVALRRTEYKTLAGAAVLSSVFFVGSLVRVPLGPGSVHLVLSGLLGLILGPAVFPAVLVGLLLQAVLFLHGGLAVLGVNTAASALPALACHYLFRGAVRRGTAAGAAGAFCCGAGSVAGTGLLAAAALGLTSGAFLPAAEMLLLAHIPVMLVEGVVTALAVRFIAGNCPQLFGLPEPPAGKPVPATESEAA